MDIEVLLPSVIEINNNILKLLNDHAKHKVMEFIDALCKDKLVIKEDIMKYYNAMSFDVVNKQIKSINIRKRRAVDENTQCIALTKRGVRCTRSGKSAGHCKSHGSIRIIPKKCKIVIKKDSKDN